MLSDNSGSSASALFETTILRISASVPDRSTPGGVLLISNGGPHLIIHFLLPPFIFLFMFYKPASLVLALAAVLHVSADAAADKAAANKAAEADLVGKLRLAPTANDRLTLLSTDDQFKFDFFDPAAAATTGKGGKIVTANAATFPAVIGQGSAMAAGFLEPCSMNTPHMHPRATEIQISLNSTIRTGMITENGARFIMTELPPGSMTIFPMGSIHFQVNDGCEPALFIASFNSEDPGVLQVAQRFLGLPPDIVGATLGDLGLEEVVGLEAQIPDNVATGTDACLKKCGLKRETQPTTQRQPRVSGNALPSGYSATDGYKYTYTNTAQPTKATSTSAPYYTAAPVNHIIQVGLNKTGGTDLTYNPANITAAVGDTVTFEFHPKNHTVTQSSFEDPCKALAETSKTGQVGFKSGFMPVDPAATHFPTFQIKINDTKPIWGYCGQQGPPVHCTKGMVFSINAVESGPNNFDAFRDRAEKPGSGYSYGDDKSYAQDNTKTYGHVDTYTDSKGYTYYGADQTSTYANTYYTTTASKATSTSAPYYTAAPVNHIIQVGLNKTGGADLTYNPSNISAAVGDTVTFEFHPKNHTVTQSSFSNPCKPLAETSTTGQVGFKSGFMFVDPAATYFPTFQIKINDTQPIWGYCGQQGPPVHCTQGMVFSINAVESGPNNFAAFQALARKSGSKNATAGVGGSFLASDGDDNSNGDNGGSKKPSTEIIALLAINGALVLGLIVLAGLYIRKRRAASRINRHKQLYTSLSVSGDPIFVAPKEFKTTGYEDAEGHAAAAAGDSTPLTHGLTHGPYYDPHEPGSRPPSRLR
ncbi:hypothetical protein C8R43DRAFT_1112030 [Mycena crocata]|nr:hypothetical protein C8R43DRAFT_1112030 [Mycena crocata]